MTRHFAIYHVVYCDVILNSTANLMMYEAKTSLRRRVAFSSRAKILDRTSPPTFCGRPRLTMLRRGFVMCFSTKRTAYHHCATDKAVAEGTPFAGPNKTFPNSNLHPSLVISS